MTITGSGPPPEFARQRFLSELFDAISSRTALLVLGVLVIQMGFVLSYVGAFHSPTPHEIPVAVVAPTPVSAQAVVELNALRGDPLHAVAVTSEEAGRRLLDQGSVSAVLVVSATGTTDTLLVSAGGGASVAAAVQAVITKVDALEHRTVNTIDALPAQPGDARGLTGFYLVVGWLVGGYLMASLLGISSGARPATTRRALIRLLSAVPYAVISGLGGAIIVTSLGALTGHFLALWWLGALLVFSAAAVTMAFQVLFGVLGVGLTVILFVVLGNPSAGGAYPPALLPPFWRALSGAIPTGAGVSAVRKIVYFGAHAIDGNLLVIGIYVVTGVLVTILGAGYHDRRSARSPFAAGAPTS
jgi:hypothetical protein